MDAWPPKTPHRGGRRAATIKDVAAKAGLHPSSVSRALAGHAGVSAHSRELVEEAARLLDYQPNALARGLRMRRSAIVGLVVPDIENEWYSTLASVMEPMLERSGYVMQLSISRDEPSRERKALRALADHQARGVILTPCGMYLPADPGLQVRLPLVEITRYTDSPTDKVFADDDTGAYEATTHLISLGHQRIALVTSSRLFTTSSARVQGYERALRSAGLPIDDRLVLAGQNTVAWGLDATRRALDMEHPPTAIVSSGHLIALGAIEVLRDRGLSFPGDFSLILFDDTQWVSAWPGGITAIRAPWTAIAQTAVDLLLQQVDRIAEHRPPRPPVTRLFPVELIIRGSTGPPSDRQRGR